MVRRIGTLAALWVRLRVSEASQEKSASKTLAVDQDDAGRGGGKTALA